MAAQDNRIYDYRVFNATDIKSFIIRQLSSSENPVFKDVNYFGSNMNAFIDTIAVMLQQMLFHLSLNTAETTFANAQLYESMNKLSSLLNYKPFGKQTSILPVKITMTVPPPTMATGSIRQLTIPRFLQITHNSNYVLKNEINREVSDTDTRLFIDAAMFQGTVHQSQVYTASGDEFEKFTLIDTYIGTSSNFISDNFFSVYVDESTDGSGDWHEYTETPLLFDGDADSRVYERRFNEDYNYEFKFGGENNGRRLAPGNRVVIYYIVSDGEAAVIGDGDVVYDAAPTAYSNPLFAEIIEKTHSGSAMDIDGTEYLGNITISNTGPSTGVTYPETVESIRANAPKVFSSLNRLTTLDDYKRHIMKNFSSYCRDVFVMNNNTYTASYLKYYCDLGIDRPQGDSRLNMAQVNFMTACDFANIYAVVLPKVDTVLSWKVPNYLNSALKQEMVESTESVKGVTHNLVPLDPIYFAHTWGSTFLDDTDWNPLQLQNRLVLVRARNSRVSYKYMRDAAASAISNYFDTLGLGDPVNMQNLSSAIASVGGVKEWFIRDAEGNIVRRLSLYRWNPLYAQEDRAVVEQTIIPESFSYSYFYDRNNIAETITIEDET